MALSLATIAQAPRIMDAIICTLSSVGIVAMEGGCASGSAALGESGVSLSWAIGPPLLGLVAIMELAMWLQRLYMAPRWAPPVVALVGCPALLGLIGGSFGGLPGFGWELGAIMGVPVALAFTAYWIPLSRSQVGTVREAGAQRAAEQLDAPDEAGAVASAGRRLRR